MICYTVITNNWDTLKEPVISEGWEYICFTDDPELRSDVWDMRVTDRPQREVKIKGYKYFGNEPALYIDGSIKIIGDLNRFTGAIRRDWSAWKHPLRDCIFDEAEAVITGKDRDRAEVMTQMERYESIPRNWGLWQTGVMYGDFRIEWVRKLSRLWYHEVANGIDRDQLSLSYCAWAMGKKPHSIPEVVIDKFFKLHFHRDSLWNHDKPK